MDALVLCDGYISSNAREALASIDCATELCACDADPHVLWGPGWSNVGGSSPSNLPSEGGFVLRPLMHPLPVNFGRNGRFVTVPQRVKENFGELIQISNLLFMEVRYCMPPSLLRFFDFDDFLEGYLRVLVLPEYDDDAIRVVICVEYAESELRSYRLTNLMHVGCCNAMNLAWPTTTDIDEIDEPNLFPHQRRTVCWMRNIESQGLTSVKIYPVQLKGETFGEKYAVPLICGGIVAHPPGSGKTRLIRHLQGLSIVICPNHLVPHWNQEVPGAHVIGFEDAVPPSWLDDSDPACAKTGKIFDDAVRLIIDEPQDVPAGARKNVQVLCESFHKPRWVLCGTAYEAHWEACAQAVMGRALFSALSFRAEQLGRPCVGHFIRHRVVRDLKSKCLPYPPLGIETIPVPLRIRETLDAKVVSLAGFLMDSILFLSYGAKVAAKAVDERQKWLTQMGWRVPATLQVLDGQEWSSIEDLTQSKLKTAKNELELLESHAAIQQSAALKVDIRADRVRVTLIDGNESKVVEAATAEWNWVCCVQARLNLRHGVKVIPDVGSDWAQMTTDAAAEGAVAVIFTTKREELAVMSRTAAAVFMANVHMLI